MGQLSPPVKIAATADFRPGPRISNEMLAESLGGKDVPLACRFFGVEGRHWAADLATGEVDPSHLTSGLAIRAGRAALDRAGLEPDRIDAVICATCTPEFLLPQTSTLVQTGLGIPDPRCLDLRAGCAGVVQAIDLGAMLIANGRARHVLVTGSDCFSPQNWPRVQEPSVRSMDDVMDAAMLSDMAAAAVLSPCDDGEPGQLLYAASGSPRPEVEPGLVTEPLVPLSMLPFEWAPRRKMARPPRVSQRHNLIGTHLPQVIREAIRAAEAASGLGWTDFSAVIGPQANPALMRTVNEQVSLQEVGEVVEDERKPFVIGHRIGNCPGAAVLQGYHILCDEAPPPPGSRVLLLGAESPRWTYSLLVVAA